MEHISSRQNPLVKQIRALTRGRGAAGEILLDGPHLVEEAFRSELGVTLVVVSSDALEGPLTPLVEVASRRSVRIVTLPPALFESVAPTRQSSGLLALAGARAAPLDDMARAGAMVLVLAGVQDPGNVGAIIRAGDACGATGVIVGAGSADPWGWKALRGGMGSTFRLPVMTGELGPALEGLRSRGLRILATTPRGGTPLAQSRLDGSIAILLGGEGAGLPADLLALADDRVTIEMRPPVESLNVAITAALITYEASRQRTHVTVR